MRTMTSVGSPSYRTVARRAVAEIEVSRSRFRCLVERVEDEPAARAVVDAVRKEHWDARHHCTAFVLGPTRAVERSNDDGEPAGTAGAPMLDVLRGAGVSDAVAVVTRWFGGVLLGTGGLARAYADATRAALDEAGTVRRILVEEHVLAVDHADAGRVEHALRARGVDVLGTEYADLARLRVAVPPADRSSTVALVAELTAGRAQLTRLGENWVDA
jgi:uncharacterized YigZ family protein